MACTCVTCGTGYSGSCCPTCQPANSIYQGECTDPGTLNPGRHLQVLDYKFCERRLTNAAGFLVNTINGSGNSSIAWSSSPQVALSDVQAVVDSDFGNLIVLGSDNRWRYLTPPAGAGLYLQTNATGNVVFGSAPTAMVPDPLAINDLSVANNATFNNLTTSGTVTLNGIASGTVVNLLGLNGASQLVTQSLAAGIAGTMFYESSTSPSSADPNAAKTNGSYLIIGNRLFDSGANLISVTTSEAITVNVAGKYTIDFGGLIRLSANSNAAIGLEINGVIVNMAGRIDAVTVMNGTSSGIATFNSSETRSLAVGDVIKLQLSRVGTAATYNVRLNAQKFAD